MKRFIKTAFFIIAAAFSVFFAAGAYAESELPEEPQIDENGYVKVTEETVPENNASYYIDDVVKIYDGIMFPESSTLLIKKGAELQLYAGGIADIRGTLVVEQGARVTVSGTFRAAESSKVECNGEFAATKSSEVHIAGEFINGEESVTAFSGKLSLYNSGVYENKGATSFAKSAEAVLSGNYIVPENGRLFIRGSVSTTLNAKMTADGYVYLSGRLYNTGELSFGKKAVNIFKDGQFVLGKSGRVIDERAEDKSENDKESGDKKTLRGIDVSYYQGTVDWKRVKAAGIDFAFLRSSVGDYYTDETFDYNMTEAQRAGIKVGVYHYCRANSAESARAEAKYFLDIIKPYKPDFPIVVDIEDSRQEKLSVEELTLIVDIFCKEVKKAGYEPMIYSSASWLNNKLDTKKLSDYEIWVAHWGTLKPAFNGDYGVWQYSCKGRVSGISGAVDLNIAYKDYS